MKDVARAGGCELADEPVRAMSDAGKEALIAFLSGMALGRGRSMSVLPAWRDQVGLLPQCNFGPGG